MRKILGIPVPDSVVKVQVRAAANKKPGRPRVFYSGDASEELDQQDLIDSLSGDRDFWHWANSLIQSGRLSSKEHSPNTVTLRVSCVFQYQDGNNAILDPGTGQTVYTFDELWEFVKSPTSRTEQDAIVGLVDRLTTLLADSNRSIVEQNRVLPDLVCKVLKEVSDQARTTTVVAAQESSRVITSLVEPLKAQLTIIEKHSNNETERANKSTDAVIRALMSDASQSPKDPRGEEERLFDSLERGWRFFKTVSS